MTASEVIIPTIIVVVIVLFLAGLWWMALVLLGIALLLLFTGLGQIDTDPPHMGLVQTVGGFLTKTLIRNPRFVIASKILGEDVIPITKEPFNWDFEIKDVECSFIKGDPTAPPPDNFKIGGKVTVKLSWTGGIVEDGEHAYAFVKQGREKGVFDKFEDRLEELVRKHGTYTPWEIFVGQKLNVFPELINGEATKLVTGLGLESGIYNVKAINPAGKVAEVSDSLAQETRQRESERLDTETAAANAKVIFDAARAAGDTSMTFERALEIDRIQRGRSKEILLRTGDKDKVMGPIIGAALRDNNGQNPDDTNHNDNHHETEGDGNVSDGHH